MLLPLLLLLLMMMMMMKMPTAIDQLHCKCIRKMPGPLDHAASLPAETEFLPRDLQGHQETSDGG
jgi:hypothetical protein